MKLPVAFLIAAALTPGLAPAVCILPDPIAGHPETNAFTATVTGAWVVGGQSALKHGERFKIHYSYRVESPVRGEARTDLVLYSTALYSDPNSDEVLRAAEGVSYFPGDTIIVAYDAQTEVSVDFCASSGHWRGSLSELKEEWAQ